MTTLTSEFISKISAPTFSAFWDLMNTSYIYGGSSCAQLKQLKYVKKEKNKKQTTTTNKQTNKKKPNGFLRNYNVRWCVQTRSKLSILGQLIKVPRCWKQHGSKSKISAIDVTLKALKKQTNQQQTNKTTTTTKSLMQSGSARLDKLTNLPEK